MNESQKTEEMMLDAALAEQLVQVCAQFDSAWHEALKGGATPEIEVYLARIGEAERGTLRHRLERIQLEYRSRLGTRVGHAGDTTLFEPRAEGKADIAPPGASHGTGNGPTVRLSDGLQGGVSADAPAAGAKIAARAPVAEQTVAYGPGQNPKQPWHDDRGELNAAAAGAPDSADGDFSLADGCQVSTAREKPTVPGYEIVGELGRGGMGVVYKARQKGLNRWVALKMVLAGAYADERQLARFRTEAEAIARLQHPNIVQVYEIGEHDGLPYFSLELIEGGSLDHKVHSQPQPPREAARMIESLARAVHYAHQRDIVHRDLKPANVLLTRDGVPKVTDFGLAKRLEDNSGQTRTGTLMGTPSYMAPEQARGDVRKVGPLADVYALGAMLYELLTGRPPFLAESAMDTVCQVTTRDPVPPTRLESGVPRDLETICLKCLEKEPPKRYPSALALAEDLANFLAAEPIRARPVSQLGQLLRWARRNPKLAGLLGMIGVLLVTVALVSFLSYLRIRKEKAETERQAALALDTAYNVAAKLDEKLRDKAGMGALRQELLGLVLKNLGEVYRSPGNLAKADRTTGVAVQRIGTFYEEMGQSKEAIQSYQQALKIFERLIAQHSDEDRNRLNAAVCYDNLGEMGREVEPDPAVLFDYYRKALELREALVKEAQAQGAVPAESWQLLSVSSVKLGTLCLVMGDSAQAADHAREAVEQANRAAAAAPGDHHARRIICSNALFLLGRASAHTGAIPAARRALEECRRLREELVQAEPLNAKAKQELASTYGARGELERENGQPQAALGDSRKGQDLLVELVRKDPKNPEMQWYLSNSDYRLGTVYWALGDLVKAAEHFQASRKTREALTKDDPDNPQRQIELLLARARCGRHEEASKLAAAIAAKAPRHPGVLFAVAGGYALCIPAVAQGKAEASLSDAERSLRNSYADAALKILQQAIECGYHDAMALEHDPDLEPLRANPRYHEILKGVLPATTKASTSADHS
jgi:serine/threonine-protein kinase